MVQVNVTTLFNTLPGETRQFFHQDDGLWPVPRPHPSFLCNALIAIDDFDEHNGATTIVPFSHMMFDQPPDQKHPDQIQLSMKSGSCVFWEGGLWHAGGANKTSAEGGNYRERMGFFISHAAAYLRPQEIQLVSVPRPVVREMPRLLQRLCGYHRFALGVDGRDPLDVLMDEDNPAVYMSPDVKLAGELPAYAANPRSKL